jgi:dethiobiotin synthase
MTLAIVGTGTGVGKTLVAATILARFGAEMPLAYWKPVATGSSEERDTETVAALAGDRAVILAESYLFPEPLSPHLAARLAGSRIEPATLLADFDRHCAAHPALVIEMAGGLLVPLTDGEIETGEGDGRGTGGDLPGEAGRGGAPPRGPDAGRRIGGGSAPGSRGAEGVGAAGGPRDRGAEAAGGGRGWPFRAARIEASPAAPAAPPAGAPLAAAGYLQADLLVDMARRAALACLVVARSGLGTINHTLLTIEALRARGLAIAGVALDGPPNRENRLAIQRFGHVDTIFEVPHFSPIDRQEVEGVARFFDHDARLAPLLRVGGPNGSTAGDPAARPRRPLSG